MERSIGIEISRDNQVNLRDRPHFFMCPSLRTYFSQKTNNFSKKYIYIFMEYILHEPRNNENV